MVHAGTSSRQKIHGRMKYRGSTSGADMSERAVVANQSSAVDVAGEADEAAIGGEGSPVAGLSLAEEALFSVIVPLSLGPCCVGSVANGLLI